MHTGQQYIFNGGGKCKYLKPSLLQAQAIK